MDLMKQAASTMSDAITAQASVCDDLRLAIQGIVHMKSPTSSCLSTDGASTVKEAQTRVSVDGSRLLLQSQSATSKKVCDRPDVRRGRRGKLAMLRRY